MNWQRLFLVWVVPVFFFGCGGDTPDKQEPTLENKEKTEEPLAVEVENAAGEANAAGEKASTNTTGADENATASDEKRMDGPVAFVNGKPIDSAVFYKKVDAVLKHNSRLPAERKNRVKQSFLKRLIEDELINQAVKEAGVVAPTEAIEEEYKKYKKRFKTDDQFNQYLKRAKLTEADIRKRIEDKKLVWLLLEKKGDLKVTDGEAEEFYKKNKRFYEERETVKARHILVKVAKNAAKEAEAKALKKIEDAQSSLKKGTAFEDVAKQFSEGPSAARGGLLTPFGRNQMVKPFEEKAFAMKTGEISPPVRTRHGFHIIEVLEKKEARTKPFEEVKEGILDSLRNKKFFTARRTLVAGLRKDAKVEQKIEFPVAAPSGHGSVPGLPHGHPPIRGKAPNSGSPTSVKSLKPKPAQPASKPVNPTPAAPVE